MIYSEWIRRHRRTIGVPLIALALYLAHFEGRYLWASILLVTLGEGLRFWASGHLRKDQSLTTGGPYRWIRNPLYLGSFLIAIGFCLIGGSIWIWILVAAYFLLCYLPVIRYEEGVLAEKFPDDYQKYRKQVPGLYPGWKPYSSASSKFSLQQAIQNKEYNAMLGILVGYAVLMFLRS
jgi:protein-S-isoprenylcysteine O-methyltransferase Ste14